MGLVALQVSVELTPINCGQCGGTYAINERYREQQYQKGGSWTCPYCKVGWGYGGNSENEKLRRELAAERQRMAAALARENEQRMERERLERKLKRVNNGVCPCCTRSFQNLAAHMKNKHPELLKPQDGKLPKEPTPPKVKPSEFDRAKAKYQTKKRIPESG